MVYELLVWDLKDVLLIIAQLPLSHNLLFDVARTLT